MKVTGFRGRGSESLKYVLSHFIAKMFIPNAMSNKNFVQETFHFLKESTKYIINTSDLIDDTKAELLEKVKSLDWQFQYPPAVLDQTVIQDFYGPIKMQVMNA